MDNTDNNNNNNSNNNNNHDLENNNIDNQDDQQPQPAERTAATTEDLIFGDQTFRHSFLTIFVNNNGPSLPFMIMLVVVIPFVVFLLSLIPMVTGSYYLKYHSLLCFKNNTDSTYPPDTNNTNNNFNNTSTSNINNNNTNTNSIINSHNNDIQTDSLYNVYHNRDKKHKNNNNYNNGSGLVDRDKEALYLYYRANHRVCNDFFYIRNFYDGKDNGTWSNETSPIGDVPKARYLYLSFRVLGLTALFPAIFCIVGYIHRPFIYGSISILYLVVLVAPVMTILKLPIFYQQEEGSYSRPTCYYNETFFNYCQENRGYRSFDHGEYVLYQLNNNTKEYLMEIEWGFKPIFYAELGAIVLFAFNIILFIWGTCIYRDWNSNLFRNQQLQGRKSQIVKPPLLSINVTSSTSSNKNHEKSNDMFSDTSSNISQDDNDDNYYNTNNRSFNKRNIITL
ncbi:hypothetical protein DFA_03295 [Cavenderia fasciculata]|uniref:Uncharacterized protein n=1 Tax=Cavenderia fasciculata TaxID=261658 RepID=F4PH65_CACFS|nr:uncharacterized protein DFA_03295 [Cavenderia fasciculata]EGG25049.1 hypothetical protein DFA_03295 [Cavenderia fasciculata]|eukprot:XP_004362900.1 hypothetical protein DFA_03295 [Cavenderia fasciculata]